MAERRKRTNEFIPDEKSRLACFKRRSKTVIKNASELSILCDVDVAAIIFADNLPHPPLLFPPDPSERERIIRRFQQSRRRGPNHENQRSNSNDKERAYISSLSSAELKSLCRSLDAKIDEFDKMINALRQRDALSVICPAIQPQWQRRLFNLAALLENVLQKAQSELYNWRGSGFSVMEMSDRVKAFLSVMQKAESDLRLLLGISNEYAVLFLKGGAATQFSALPLNLRKPEGLVHCLVTGYWGDQASKEALEYNVNYFHLCANETSRAVELPGLVIGDLSLLDVSKLGPIYARARNNFGPSGVTLAVIKQSRR